MKFSGLMLLLMSCLWSFQAAAAGKPVVDATAEEEAAARDAFGEAKTHYEAGRLEQALAGYRQSYEIVASPNSHLMVARVLDEMGRSVDAYREMRSTMREAEALSQLGGEVAAKYDKALVTATALSAELRKKVGLIVVEVPEGIDVSDGGTLWVNGKPVRSIAEPLVVEPGTVDFVLQTPDGKREARASVTAGGQAKVRLERPTAPLVPDPEPPPPDRPEGGGGVTLPLAITAAAIGGAGLVVFGVFGGLTVAAFDDLETSCPNARCTPDKQSDIDDAKGFQVAANVGLIVGVTGVLVSVALFVFDATLDDTAVLRPTRDGLAIGGTF